MAESEPLATPVPYVVHGSFRKHLDEIAQTIEMLNSTRLVQAIAPHNCAPDGEHNGFVLLSGEADKDPLEIEFDFMAKVDSLRALGGFAIWVNPGGYSGTSAAYEYGEAKKAGLRSFFTHPPEDVPFHVNPHDILSAKQLADSLVRHQGVPPFQPDTSRVGQLWENRRTATAQLAVGGIVQCHNQLLLVEDGRWQGKLTVAGTTVRGYEDPKQALSRLANQKFGLRITDVVPLRTSLMLSGDRPSSPKVFDDQLITLENTNVAPGPGLTAHWFTPDEIAALLASDQVEPNAKALLGGLPA